MREKINWNDGWRFHKGDIQVSLPNYKGVSYMQAKTEREKIGPAAWHYIDEPDSYDEKMPLTREDWVEVELPHDYMITQAPRSDNSGALGCFKYENAWYRKHFILPEENRNKRITILFEGIAVAATVYLNGCLLKRNFCGYTSFEVDITDFVRFGEENVLAVYVDATSAHEGWWYEGAGIYRPVWMIITEKVFVDLWGVYIRPVYERKTGIWDTAIEVTLDNRGLQTAEVEVENRVCSPDGGCLCSVSGTEKVGVQNKAINHTSFQIKEPQLWDVDNPRQYITVTSVKQNGHVIDQVITRFGFRTLEFDADRGLFLNGRHVIIKGVCCHQDYGLTGKAVPERVQRYRLRLLKEMGANGFRTSHYPHSEVTMDALDDMGFLVMDETRWFSSSEEGRAQLEMLIKRDRNRPSVIFWSIANEEHLSKTEAGKKITETLRALIKTLDADRPVTSAISTDPLHAPAAGSLDAIGINYNLEQYDEIHKKYPNIPVFSSECCATGTTRGWYFPNDERLGYLYGYDRDTNNWFRGREATWRFFMERPYVMGGYQWIAVEHRGESTWPRLCSQSGALDLYLQKKDAFYQNRSHWSEEPMIHLLPHWNWPGQEGERILVYAYTNCEEAELFLNGVSLGRQTITAPGHGEWRVPYESGELAAKGYRNGECAAEDRRETTGRAVALKLRIEDGESLRADGRDVAILTCYCVDEEGRAVPDASPEITFTTNGLGKIAATGSDVSDHIPPAYSTRKMRAGLCSVLVKAGETPGELRVYARADGMSTGSANIELYETA